ALLIENALLGLIAGVLGMVGVGLAMVWINDQRPQAQLSLDPVLAVVMTGVSVALALLSASLVAWRPTHVRPLEVLRNEERGVIPGLRATAAESVQGPPCRGFGGVRQSILARYTRVEGAPGVR